MSKIIRKIIKTAAAPAPGGAFSQAVIVDRTMYMSGQVGRDPVTGKMVEGGVEAETEQALKNMAEVLKAAGADMSSVVKATVLLADIKDMPKVNAIYAKYFTSNHPARAAYQVANLPVSARIEIEAIAVVGEIEDQ